MCCAVPSSKEHIKGGLSSTLQDIIRMLCVLRANFMQFYLLYLPAVHIPYSALHCSMQVLGTAPLSTPSGNH